LLPQALGGGRDASAAESTVPSQLLYREFATRRGLRTPSGRRLSASPNLKESFGGASSTEIVLLNRRGGESPVPSPKSGKKPSQERDDNLVAALACVDDMSFSLPKAAGKKRQGRRGLTKSTAGAVRTQRSRFFFFFVLPF
jgi:hypothetical protein